MNTIFLLMAQFGPRAIIPIEEVCTAYFPHLELKAFTRKIASGDIPLPVVRIEDSKQASKGVYAQDLADYIDAKRAVAVKERNQLCGLR
ncbi:MAG: pyocin activator PrtN family protein [Paraburkholderia sp.]|uniref:pyocin activator PrtN family protein n=1 Tax=Burkholderiaceae TaxID=119060 RepID=UPI0010F4723E|nr:pyocin activator PrtN family protein [Burkholderia sp. 4M9327F10]